MTLNSPTRLPKPHVKLAIATAIADKIKLEDLIEKLWREDPVEVETIYHSIADNRASDGWLNSYQRRKERRKKAKLLTRKKYGLTLNAIADRTGIAKATLVSLMEHHGLLELVQFGLEQKRRLVTEVAYHAHLGHNVNPANRIGHVEGQEKAANFPVFYEERLPDILWMLDFEGIKETVSKLSTKKAKLSYLLGHHGYLPDGEIAALAGYNRSGVIKARQSGRRKVVIQTAQVATSAHANTPSVLV